MGVCVEGEKKGGEGAVPVDGLRGEFFGAGGFDRVDPACGNEGQGVSIRAQSFPSGFFLLVRTGVPFMKGVDGPGIGSFPCLFKNAEYAMMNF